MNEGKIYITYVRDKNKFPVACIASKATSVSKEPGEMIRVEYAISSYNPVDPFNKKLGRKIAEDRLKVRPYGWFNITPKYVKLQLLWALVDDRNLPTATRLAAKVSAAKLAEKLKPEVGDGQGQEKQAS